MKRRLRHKLVQLAYLGKGVLEAGLGELRRHDGGRVLHDTDAAGNPVEGSYYELDEKALRFGERYGRRVLRDEVANGDTPH